MYSKSNSLREEMKQLISICYLIITTTAATVTQMQPPETLEKVNYVAALAGETISCHVDSDDAYSSSLATLIAQHTAF